MRTNRELTQSLMRHGYLKSPNLIHAFEEIDRADFVPLALKDQAYFDEPLSIGFAQTISQPLTVAFMLELLDLKSGNRILEIGAGSGWQTALIAHVVGGGLSDQEPATKGRVVAIERIGNLCETARANIGKYNFIKKGVVKLIHGDGTLGYKPLAPFDRVIAAATARHSVPVAWRHQVRVGGRIVAPVGETIEVWKRVSPTDFRLEEYQGFRFVPLITKEGGNG